MDGLAALEILYASPTAEALHHGPAQRPTAKPREWRSHARCREARAAQSRRKYGGADSDIVTSARLPRPMRSPSSPRPRSGSGTLPVHYSMTRSARPRIVGEIVIPRALAVLRFTASSIFVGNSTGRSLGLVPCRILSTKFDIR